MSCSKYSIPVNEDGDIIVSLPGLIDPSTVKIKNFTLNPNLDSFRIQVDNYEISFINGAISLIRALNI